MLAVVLAHNLFTHRPADYSEPKSRQCWVNVTDMIGISLRAWALDHRGQYPFNVSTNQGGTLELCARGSDGFDSNAWRHFQVLSNELTDPAFLVCPKDRKHKPARDFRSLRLENVSYRLRTGPSLTQTNKTDVLVVCPLDGNCIYGDGHWEGEAPAPAHTWSYATSVRQGVGQLLITLGAGALLLGLGAFLNQRQRRRERSPKPTEEVR